MAIRYSKIRLSKLVLWEDNPRIAIIDGATDSTKSIIKKLYQKNPTHFRNLANDIADKGLVPNEFPVVIYNEESKNYSVYEGNRRISILKAIYSPSLVDFDGSLYRLFKKLKHDLDSEKVSFKVSCCIVDSLDDAMMYVERIHNGEDNGRGRITWGHLEKESFKVTRNSIQNTDVKTSPVYTIMSNYPEFKELVDLLLPSNVNRLLVSSDLKESMQIKSFDNLNPLQIELLKSTLNEAHRLSVEHKMPISRLFRKVSDTRERLIPYIEKVKTELLGDEKYKNVKQTVVIPDLKIKVERLSNKKTNTLNLLPYISNYDSFERIDIRVFQVDTREEIQLNDFILPNGLTEGMYQIQYNGYINENMVSSKSVELEIEPFIKPERAAKRRLSYLIDTSGHKIKISNSVDKMIVEINSLSFEKYPMVLTSSLRFLVEESLKIAFGKQNWHFSESSLESKLVDLKKLTSKPVITSINDRISIGFHPIKNFLDGLDAQKVANKLNTITHSPDVVPNDEIVDLAKSTISRLLVILTGLC